MEMAALGVHMAERWLILDSGHGGQTKDLDGDEVDGLDEGSCFRTRMPSWGLMTAVIFPVDYRHTGHIVDDVSV